LCNECEGAEAQEEGGEDSSGKSSDVGHKDLGSAEVEGFALRARCSWLLPDPPVRAFGEPGIDR
jgi:hypothetical protein